jgi:hypothetical protein
LRRVQGLAGACLLLLAASGCQKIAGIEEAKYFGDGGAEDGGSDAELNFPDAGQCEEYCNVVKSACPTTFKDEAYCDKLCPNLPLAEKAGAKTGNTFECRLDQLKTAQAIGSEDSREHCLRAGPGGDGVCGSNCDSYCQLFSTICGDRPQLANDCVNQCEKLVSDPTVDGAAAFGAQLDTVQCRLAHLSAAAFAPDPHCEHASIYIDKLTPCYTATPNCDDYCGLMQNVCTKDGGSDGENMQQYESFEDCRALCVKGLVTSEPLLSTETQDKIRDTLACRRYHVYNHLLFKGSHCEHAGPGGDGHCGRICPAYCRLVKAACADGYTMKYGSNDAACVTECSGVIEIPEEDDQVDLHYNVETGKQPGNTIQCRLYHTTKAFRTPAMSCNSALGLADSACGP